MRNPFLTASLALALGACGGARQVPGAPPAPRHVVDRVEHGDFRGAVERSPLYSSLSFAVPAAPDVAFRALVEAYESLGIDLETIQRAERLIGNARLRVRRNLAGTRLSRYFDCGRTVTGPTADSYDLTIDVRSRILADAPGSSLLVTWVRATAASPGRPRDVPIVCSSTGGLEDRLMQELSSRL